MAADLTAETSRATNAPTRDEELPDPALFWRWVGRATRPVVGWVLAGLGVIAILIGYFGISRESLVAKQLPFLISGGIGGIALVGAGAALIATEDLRRFRTRLERLEGMVGDLHSVLLSRPDAPSDNGQRPAATSAASARGGLVALPTGKSLHRADCVMVEGKAGVQPVSASAARSRRLEPCRLCEPETVSA